LLPRPSPAVTVLRAPDVSAKSMLSPAVGQRRGSAIAHTGARLSVS